MEINQGVRVLPAIRRGVRAMTWPRWLRRAATTHGHAIEQASRRWVEDGGGGGDERAVKF